MPKLRPCDPAFHHVAKPLRRKIQHSCAERTRACKGAITIHSLKSCVVIRRHLHESPCYETTASEVWKLQQFVMRRRQRGKNYSRIVLHVVYLLFAHRNIRITISIIRYQHSPIKILAAPRSPGLTEFHLSMVRCARVPAMPCARVPG